MGTTGGYLGLDRMHSGRDEGCIETAVRFRAIVGAGDLLDPGGKTTNL